MKNDPALSPSASDSRLFDAQRSRGIPRLSWWRRSLPGGRSSSGADESPIADEPLAVNSPAASRNSGAVALPVASAPTEPAVAARNGAARFGATSRTILGAARARSVRVGALAGWRISAVLLLVAFAALLALPAQAQTAGTLVSNLEQTDTSGSTSQLAQAFDTGSNAAGYGLTSVTLRLAGGIQIAGRECPGTDHASDQQRPGLERLDQDHHTYHPDVDDVRRQRLHRACRRHAGRGQHLYGRSHEH